MKLYCVRMFLLSSWSHKLVIDRQRSDDIMLSDFYNEARGKEYLSNQIIACISYSRTTKNDLGKLFGKMSMYVNRCMKHTTGTNVCQDL